MVNEELKQQPQSASQTAALRLNEKRLRSNSKSTVILPFAANSPAKTAFQGSIMLDNSAIAGDNHQSQVINSGSRMILTEENNKNEYLAPSGAAAKPSRFNPIQPLLQPATSSA